MKSIKKLMQKYGLTKDELFKIMHDCLNYYLSEEELYTSILEYYMKKENKHATLRV